MCFVIYDRVATASDRQRLNALEDELLPLLNKRTGREHDMEMREIGRGSKSSGEALYRSDPEWRQLTERINKLEYERTRLLKAHPEFRR